MGDTHDLLGVGSGGKKTQSTDIGFHYHSSLDFKVGVPGTVDSRVRTITHNT